MEEETRPMDNPQETVPDEEALTGGNVGEVTRRGDRVYRTAGTWTPAIQRLLAHLRANGIAGVPEPLGIDERGREVVSFMPGDVPGYPMPAYVWDKQTLVDSARLLRRLHDATAGYADRDAQWRQPAREPAEVICHNDVAPYNMVFEDERLTGLIDFDMASPGPRLWDLAYLAYRIVPLTDPANLDGFAFDEGERLARLGTLLDAYGMHFPVIDVLRMAQERLRHLAMFSEDLAEETGRDELRDHAALYRADEGYVEGLLGRLT